MKKNSFLLAVALMTLSITACESTAEKLCKRMHECADILCDNDDNYEICHDDMADLDKCLKEAEEAEKSKKDTAECDACYDATDVYGRCLLDHMTCDSKKGIDGVVIDTDACESEYNKMLEKCDNDC